MINSSSKMPIESEIVHVMTTTAEVYMRVMKVVDIYETACQKCEPLSLCVKYA